MGLKEDLEKIADPKERREIVQMLTWAVKKKAVECGLSVRTFRKHYVERFGEEPIETLHRGLMEKGRRAGRRRR